MPIVVAERNPAAKTAFAPAAPPRELPQAPQAVVGQRAREEQPFDAMAALLAKQAAAHGSSMAMEAPDGPWSYAQLNAAANRLAWQLRELGARPGERIAVCLEAGPQAIVAFLGVLKSGAALIPLEPCHPMERRAHKLADAAPRVLISQLSLADAHPPHGAQMVVIDEPAVAQAIGLWPSVDLPSLNDSGDVAYIIYTSGSTGKPKGVQVSHGALVTYAQAVVTHYELTPADRVLQFSSLAFDICIEEIFPTLLAGACLVHKTPAMTGSVSAFLAQVQVDGITVLNLPTAFWHELVLGLSASPQPLPPAVRLLVVGGEKASRAAYRRWQMLANAGAAKGQPAPRFLNAYGPTETTVTATVYEPAACAQDGEYAELPIGKPLGDALCHVLDEGQQWVADGEVGELWIGGPCVALGYLNLPELTAKRFLPDPFANTVGARMYRTGDRVRRLPSGDLEFLGRVDHQVKVRGYRIELTEIEAAIEQHASVAQAVVIGYTDAGGNTALAAFCQPAGTQQPTDDVLKSFLHSRLPAYMVPVRWAWVPHFALTPNGKVDRAALVVADAPVMPVAPTMVDGPPITPQVADLLAWLLPAFSEVLGLGAMAPQTSFFDAGGHSLMGLRLIARLERERPELRLSAQDLFAHPSPLRLAQHLAQRSGGQALQSSSVVRLNPPGMASDGVAEVQTPLFCICGVALYAPLAQALAHERPVYGVFVPEELQAIDAEQAVTVPKLAARYVALMRQARPHGAIQLAGISFGATLAFEIAHQLREQGVTVELLTLLDPVVNASFGLLAPAERWQRRWRSWRERRAQRGGGIPTADQQDQRLEAQRARVLDAAEFAYEATRRPYAGRCLIVSAHGVDAPVSAQATGPLGRRDFGWIGRFVSADLGWAPYLPPATPVRRVAGSHLGILKPPHVEHVAKAMVESSRGAILAP